MRAREALSILLGIHYMFPVPPKQQGTALGDYILYVVPGGGAHTQWKGLIGALRSELHTNLEELEDSVEEIRTTSRKTQEDIAELKASVSLLVERGRDDRSTAGPETTPTASVQYVATPVLQPSLSSPALGPKLKTHRTESFTSGPPA